MTHDRHPDTLADWIGIGAIAVIVCMLLAARARCEEPPRGTVFVTRNLDESQNTSPGHWNHLAIYVGNGQFVESQVGVGVISTPAVEFYKRPYEFKKLLPREVAVGERAADYAESLVGQPYGQLASVNPIFRFSRHNCVSVVEAAYDYATGRRWLWIRRPDHVFKLVGK